MNHDINAVNSRFSHIHLPLTNTLSLSHFHIRSRPHSNKHISGISVLTPRSAAGEELFKQGNENYAKNNITEAINQWSDAVQKYQHAEACLALGRCYDFGEGTKADQKKYACFSIFFHVHNIFISFFVFYIYTFISFHHLSPNILYCYYFIYTMHSILIHTYLCEFTHSSV